MPDKKTKTPAKTEPKVSPAPVRRYDPEPDHCPGQWTRTVRRISP